MKLCVAFLTSTQHGHMKWEARKDTSLKGLAAVMLCSKLLSDGFNLLESSLDFLRAASSSSEMWRMGRAQCYGSFTLGHIEIIKEFCCLF